jgi:hypothetical protein
VVPSALEGAKDNDVATFALRRPDGRISLLLVNRSATRPHLVAVDTRRGGGRVVRVRGPATIFSYGPRQYSWIDAGQQSHPGRDRPPVRRHLGAEPLNLELRPLTMTVIVLDNGKM